MPPTPVQKQNKVDKITSPKFFLDSYVKSGSKTEYDICLRVKIPS